MSASTGATKHSAGRASAAFLRDEAMAYELLVGIDWATQAHQVCVLTPNGDVLEERAVAHEAQAIHTWVEALLRRADGRPEAIAVAIEVPRGALVETLIERGLHVYALNPKQLDRFRDRHSVAGAKDDRRDAFVLADALRGDRPKFRRVALDDEVIVRIREVSRADAELLDETTQLTNRLREQLYRVLPTLLPLSPSADEPWFWELIERVVSARIRRPTRAQIQSILRRHRIRRLDEDDVLAALAAPRLYTAPGTVEAAYDHIRLLLPRLRLAYQQRKSCEKTLEELLDSFEDPEEEPGAVATDLRVLRSCPGVGPRVAAALLAEASQALRERDWQTLRTYAGVAPVTKRSGKSLVVVMRYACNGRLRNALHHWANTSVQCDPASRAYYATLRARGHRHPRALRALADRWLRVLIAMLKSQTLYDPEYQRRRVPAAA